MELTTNWQLFNDSAGRNRKKNQWNIYQTNSKYYCSNTEIESVLRNLPNNKAIGYNGIYNEMFKYAASLRLKNSLATI